MPGVLLGRAGLPLGPIALTERYKRMNIRQIVLTRLYNTNMGKRMLRDPFRRVVFSAAISFSLNLLYALYHGVLGIINLSIWFTVLCAYYTVLATMRFCTVLCGRKGGPVSSADAAYFTMKLSGVLLVLLSIVLASVNYVSLSQNIAAKYDEIIMITIAVYTFSKLAAVIVKAVRQHENPSPLLAVIRNIGYAEVAAAVLTLQRSMLVSFGSMNNEQAHIMNMLTGVAVCIFVLVLGIRMIGRGMRKK